jgi:hypothetical protein
MSADITLGAKTVTLRFGPNEILRGFLCVTRDSIRRIQGPRAPAPASRPKTTGGNRPHRLRLQDSRKEPLLVRAFEQPHTADFRSKPSGRGRILVERMRGRGTGKRSTYKLLKLMRSDTYSR